MQDYSSKHALIKLIIIIGLPFIFTVGFALFAIQDMKNTAATTKTTIMDTPLLTIPMIKKTWADIGSVIEPTVTIPVKTSLRWEPYEFVIDSGAVISSLPREWATKTGRDLANAKRVSFRGYGNTISFAYQSDATILLGTTPLTIPVVFTESEGTRALLGRKGFFEDHSITFNHVNQTIEIR